MSEHREPKLLGNDKLTVAARLSSLAGAAVFGIAIGVIPTVLPRVVDYFEKQGNAIRQILSHIESQKERDTGQDHRLSQLEERATRIENRMFR